MAKRVVPSSFLCNCGHQSDFSEGVIREMESLSRRKPQSIRDDSVESPHVIEFRDGEPVTMKCPKLGPCKIEGWVL